MNSFEQQCKEIAERIGCTVEEVGTSRRDVRAGRISVRAHRPCVATLFVAFVCLVLCLSANAAAYYVDYASGLDSAPGTTSTAPWQHVPGDQAATGNAASVSLSPDDVVLVHGGRHYGFGAGAHDFISIPASGSSGHPIVYRSGDRATPQWGTTPAFIDGSNSIEAYSSTMGIIHIAHQSNFTLDGFDISSSTNLNGTTGCIGGLWDTGEGNITLCNLQITNSAGNGIILQGRFGAGVNPSGFTISNCVIHDVNAHGVQLRGGLDNVTVTGGAIYNVGAPIMGVSGGGDDIGLFMFDTTPPEDMVNNIVFSNIFLGSSLTKSSIIYSVACNGILTTGCTFGGTNKVSTFDCNGSLTNVAWENNLITNVVSTFEGVWRFAPDSDYPFAVDNGLLILNNTGVCTPSQEGFGALIYCINGGQTAPVLFYNLQVSNNIFRQFTVPMWQINTNSASPASYVVDVATFASDRNSYSGNVTFLTGGSGEAGNGGKTLSLAQWQSSFAQDTHSAATVPSFVSPSTHDFRLTGSDTIALDQGVNLFSLLQSDGYGNARPSSGAWDIGSWQHSALARIMITSRAGAGVTITGRASAPVTIAGK